MSADEPNQLRETQPLDELVALLRTVYNPDEFLPRPSTCELIAGRLYAKYQHLLDPWLTTDDDDVADAFYEALDRLVDVVAGEA